MEVRYLGRREPAKQLPGAGEPRRWELHNPRRRPRKADQHYWQAVWYAEGAAPGRYRIVVLDPEAQVLVTDEVVVP